MMARKTPMILPGLLWAATSIQPAQAGTKHYYYTDPQGTVLAKADAQGNIVATYDYAPYGTRVLGTPSSGPSGYTGHVNDAESGFVYMQQRYYDPVTGRFLSMDPVTSSAGNLSDFNRYVYANNNPIINIDPDGRMPCDICNDLINRVRGAAINYAREIVVGAANSIVDGVKADIRNELDNHTYAANVALSGTVAPPKVPGLQNLVPTSAIGGSLSLSLNHRGQFSVTGSIVPMTGSGGGRSAGLAIGIARSEGGNAQPGLSLSTSHHMEMSLPIGAASSLSGSYDWTNSEGAFQMSGGRAGPGTLAWVGGGEQFNLTYTFGDKNKDQQQQ